MNSNYDHYTAMGYTVRWIQNGEHPSGDNTWGLYQLFTPAGVYCGRVFGPVKVG